MLLGERAGVQRELGNRSLLWKPPLSAERPEMAVSAAPAVLGPGT